MSEATDQGGGNISLSLPQLMAMSVDQALSVTGDLKKVHARLTTLHDLASAYLTLGEPRRRFRAAKPAAETRQ